MLVEPEVCLRLLEATKAGGTVASLMRGHPDPLVRSSNVIMRMLYSVLIMWVLWECKKDQEVMRGFIISRRTLSL